MITTIKNDLKGLLRLPVTVENEHILRDGLQNILLKLYLEKNLSVAEKCIAATDCHKKLRELQNANLCRRHESYMMLCELRELLDDLCCACDMLLDMHGRGAVFLPPRTEIFAVCSPAELVETVLNMISNACLHSDTETVCVELCDSSDAAIIKVTNDGNTNLGALHKSSSVFGSGTAAMLGFARRHNASLLWSGGTESCAALLLPLNKEKKADQYISPDLSDLLCNRLSVIYTGLCDICKCPY